MSLKIDDIVATLREYAPDEDGTQRYILIPAAGRGAIAEYPVTVRPHRTDIMRDAADLIEQLQQELIDERYRHDRYADFCVAQGEELSKLKAQQRWIPVADCPKADGQYLVTCRSFGGQWTSTLGFARVGEDVDDYDLRGKRNVWYDYDSEYGYGAVNFVTHWMPLPKPPKEE